MSLWDEDRQATISILPPVVYEQLVDSFDLIVNVDSLTEMAPATAEKYLHGAPRLANQFLSINHERNAFTVEAIYSKMPGVRPWRSPCWIRRGYVEELICFTSQISSGSTDELALPKAVYEREQAPDLGE